MVDDLPGDSVSRVARLARRQRQFAGETQTDAFAKWDGCTIETLPTAPTGGHICTAYKGCVTSDPVTWCSFDGPHTASPTDSGQSASWMPATVWPFLSQF